MSHFWKLSGSFPTPRHTSKSWSQSWFIFLHKNQLLIPCGVKPSNQIWPPKSILLIYMMPPISYVLKFLSTWCLPLTDLNVCLLRDLAALSWSICSPFMICKISSSWSAWCPHQLICTSWYAKLAFLQLLRYMMSSSCWFECLPSLWWSCPFLICMIPRGVRYVIFFDNDNFSIILLSISISITLPIISSNHR